MKYDTLVGTTQGRWEVFEHICVNKRHLLKCRCIHCGTEQIVRAGNISSGRSRGCRTCANTDRRNGHAAQSQVLSSYRTNARLRSREWALTEDQFLTLCKGVCHYCNRAPYTLKVFPYDSFLYNGIDRKDNSKGYTVDNSLTCCKECNMCKGSMPYEKFIKWIKLIRGDSNGYRSRLLQD